MTAVRLALIVALLSVALVGGLFVFGVGQGWAAPLCGEASFYAGESGPTTANGERFKPNGRTAAMWGVPFGTRYRVTNMRNGRSVVVRINDRGPAHRLVRKGRIIDLSRGAALAIGIAGVGRVCLSPL